MDESLEAEVRGDTLLELMEIATERSSMEFIRLQDLGSGREDETNHYFIQVESAVPDNDHLIGETTVSVKDSENVKYDDLEIMQDFPEGDKKAAKRKREIRQQIYEEVNRLLDPELAGVDPEGKLGIARSTFDHAEAEGYTESMKIYRDERLRENRDKPVFLP